ncbi:MAG: right-handed parallel beta-helix repeat-containing protein, partial [Prevotellaceae bacterium]|nr:right-handed parallel beta-helix repeat-containing protein [Prevotellaceae bacterium]
MIIFVNSNFIQMKKIILTFFVLLPLSTVFAANYYCSPNGNGDGSFADPCSLTAGLAKTDLDTLFLRGGTYNLTATQRLNKNGTAQNRKAMFAYNDEKPILDFRGQAYGNRGVQFAGSYLHVKGFVICHTGKNGFYNESNNSIFENCETYGNGDTGFQMKNCHGNLIVNCDSHDNFDYQNGDVSRADFGGNADGFADKQYSDNGAPNIYDGCRAWGNSDDGWDFFDKTGNSIIRNSICFQNGPATY